MRSLVLVGVVGVALAGCGGDACDGFDGKTCIALEVRGGVHVDELRVSSTELGLRDAISARPGAPTALPVTVPVLPDPAFAGPYTLTVRARLIGADVGVGVGGGVVQPRQHVHVVAELGGGTDLAAPADSGDAAAAVEDAGDLAAPAPLDLSGDLKPLTVGNWHVATSGGPALRAVWATSARDVYVVGEAQTILHLDGQDHVMPESETDVQSLNAVSGSAAVGIYAGGSSNIVTLPFQGTGAWQLADNVDAVAALFAIDGGTILGAATIGATSVILQSVDAGGFAHVSNNTGQAIVSLWGASPSDLHVCTGMGMFHLVSGSSTPEPLPPNNAFCDTVWGTSATDVYAASGWTIYHTTGDGTWTLQQSLNSSGYIAAFTGAPGDYYAVGEGVADGGAGYGLAARSNDGAVWSFEAMPASEALLGAWAVGPGEVYAVGSDVRVHGLVLHRLP